MSLWKVKSFICCDLVGAFCDVPDAGQQEGNLFPLQSVCVWGGRSFESVWVMEGKLGEKGSRVVFLAESRGF